MNKARFMLVIFLVVVVLALLASAALLIRTNPSTACSYPDGNRIDDHEDAVRRAAEVGRLVDDLESGSISRDMFHQFIAAMPDAVSPNLINCDISTTLVLKRKKEPYRVTRDITVRTGAILIIQQGTEIIIAPDVKVTVSGRLYSIGSQRAPIRIHGSPSSEFDSIEIFNGPNQIVWTEIEHGHKLLAVSHDRSGRTLVAESRFDNWIDLAIEQRITNFFHLFEWLFNSEVERTDAWNIPGGLHVRHCRFGLQTPDDELSGETIRGRFINHLIIEQSDFGRRRGYNDVINLSDCMRNSWPVIAGNRFEGGQDDAIDLDACSAFVVGNLIRNFRPEDPSGSSSNANGGCITGSAPESRPIILNNVIDTCFQAIGFKDGSQPIIVNNTIVNSNIGVTLYQTDSSAAMPSGILINSILSDNFSWTVPGKPQDVVLNGKWWPTYNQNDDVQGILDTKYTITASMPQPLEGSNNNSLDPILEFVDGIPIPSPGSPAIGTGLGRLSFEGVPMDQVIAFLATDFLGTRRPLVGEEFRSIDRGAIQTPDQDQGGELLEPRRPADNDPPSGNDTPAPALSVGR